MGRNPSCFLWQIISIYLMGHWDANVSLTSLFSFSTKLSFFIARSSSEHMIIVDGPLHSFNETSPPSPKQWSLIESSLPYHSFIHLILACCMFHVLFVQGTEISASRRNRMVIYRPQNFGNAFYSFHANSPICGNRPTIDCALFFRFSKCHSVRDVEYIDSSTRKYHERSHIHAMFWGHRHLLQIHRVDFRLDPRISSKIYESKTMIYSNRHRRVRQPTYSQIQLIRAFYRFEMFGTRSGFSRSPHLLN